MSNSGGRPRGAMPGDVAPWFKGAVLQNSPNFAFDTMAGRHLLLLISGSMGGETALAGLRQMMAQRHLFDDKRASFFGVTRDSSDADTGRIAPVLPGIRWFLDYDGAIARRFGAVVEGESDSDFWLLLDPMLRVIGRSELDDVASILDLLRERIDAPKPEGIAPVLIVPGIFEPGLCEHLMGLYESRGGTPSGFMREVDGKTVGMIDGRVKRRSDLFLTEDSPLREQIQIRFRRRLIPLIERFLNFQVTRLERYVVACYDADAEGGAGFFSAHRDNTTAGTAHRRFACTINLNAEDYEGGDLIFPEFGTRRYRAPTGGAAIFACGMLHEAEPVRRGKRYAFLPFFYDEAAARQREANAQSGRVASEFSTYRA